MDAREAEARRMRRRHVFIVNTDPRFLQLARALLQGARYNVTTTNYLPRTFHQIVAARPALLILDLTWGEEAGWDLLERLKGEALTADRPVIVVSDDPALLEHAREDPEIYAGQAHLTLPYDQERLVLAVARLIGAADAGAGEGDADDDAGG